MIDTTAIEVSGAPSTAPDLPLGYSIPAIPLTIADAIDTVRPWPRPPEDSRTATIRQNLARWALAGHRGRLNGRR